MTDPSVYVTDRAGLHHVVNGQAPHHEDDCTPECPLHPAGAVGGSVSTFTVPLSEWVQQPVPISLHVNDGTSVDITSAQRVEHAGGRVTSLVMWEEWPRDGRVE